MDTVSPLTRRSQRNRFWIATIGASVVVAIVGVTVLVTRTTGEKVTTRGVTSTLHVRGHPGSLVASGDALWLALADEKPPARDRPLLRILASGVEQHTVFVGGQPSYLAHVGNRLVASADHTGSDGSGPSFVVAIDWESGRLLGRRPFAAEVGPLVGVGNDLWVLQVRPAALIHLDSRSLNPTASPLALSSGRGLGLAVGAGYVWATAADAGEVLRIDPATRKIERARVGGFPVGIVVAGGGVWYADRERRTVGRLDPRTLRPVGDPVHFRTEPSWLGTAGRYVFVGNAERGTVTRLDVSSGKQVGAPIRIAQPARGSPGLAMAPSGRSVWVSSFASNTVTRVSSTESTAASAAVTVSRAQNASSGHALPRGAKIVARIAVPLGGGAIAAGEGAVWAMSDSASTLMRIDPAHDKIVKRIETTATSSVAAGDGGVWLAHPFENTVTRIDPRTNKVSATIPVGPQPAAIDVSPDAVWVVNAGGPSVSRIDPATNHVVTFRVGPKRLCCSFRMGVIAASGAVWAAIPNGNELVRIDPATNRVVDTVKLPYPPCAFFALDGNTMWSSGGICADVVARIDLRTKRVTAKLTEAHPVGLGLAFGTLWVAAIGSRTVDQIDPHTGRLVARLPVSGTPVRLALGFGAVWVDSDGAVLRITRSN